jgi:hypothetical protein
VAPDCSALELRPEDDPEPMKTFAQEDCRAEILRRLRTVRPDSPRLWGQMSAHQMICHLTDACRIALGQKQVSLATGPLQRTLLKWTALYLPIRWPAGVATRPEIDQRCGGTMPADFAMDVAQLEAVLDLIATRPRGQEWPDHPIFGRMSHDAWMRWAYLHADHHLRQFNV